MAIISIDLLKLVLKDCLYPEMKTMIIMLKQKLSIKLKKH